MRRLAFVAGAVICALVAVLMATDVVNLDTDRMDRWVVIFAIAGVVFFLALAGADNEASDAPATGRAAAARALGEGRPDPATLPSKPGSLLKQQRATAAADAAPDDADVAIPVAAAAPEIELDLTEPTELAAIADIDDAQVEEITALVDEAEIDLVAAEQALEPAANEPMARLELRLSDYDDADLQRVVKESEAVVISEMVRSGQLTSEGKLTERDIASMVFLAHTSNEMLAELRLRKAMAADDVTLENADRS